MKILFSPQVSEKKVEYKFENDKITATIDNISDVFDFRDFPNGKLELRDSDTGEDMIETDLPIQPIISAERKNGELWVELLNWIGAGATEKERFPEWEDYEDIVKEQKEKSDDSDKEVEEEVEIEDWDEF